ncbi:MAG: TRAP transporter small permease [Paracoccus sp. (in: a-proteobacteria)]|nr:TRAP transporter small permease [Paracoccus sp. (in: a-proteobacteria)]
MIARIEIIVVRIIEAILVILMSSMMVMVFANVVLRYGFNQSLNFSEEMARYCFVWLTFTGAVLAFREHGHIGVETLVRMFGRRGRIICMAITQVIIIICAAVLLYGTWLQHPVNASMKAAVVGMSMIWVYGIGYFTSIGILMIAFARLFRILTGRVEEHEIARFAGEYETEVEKAAQG